MKDGGIGKILGALAVIGIGVFCYTQYRKVKQHEKELQPKIKK